MGSSQLSRWSLSSQLQVFFTLAVVTLSGLLVVITILQLDWIESKAHSLSYSVLRDSNLKRMRLLLESESNYISTEYSSYIKLVENLKSLNLLTSDKFKGISQPLGEKTPFWVEDADSNYIYYNASTYSSKYGKPPKTSLAHEVMQNTSKLDYLIPSLYKDNYFFIYEGLKEYEILNIYPGSYFKGFKRYTPFIREWFYTAKKNPSQTIITEPYIDALTKKWIFTISRTIEHNEEFLGVAALDISLAELTSAVEDITLYNKSGFLILVTHAGMVLTKPRTWNTDETIRIYDESKTGISYRQWTEFTQSSFGDDFEIFDVNNTLYTLTIGFVKPYESSENITHYILFVAENSKIYKPVDDLDKNFAYIRKVLFWTVVVCEIFVVLIGVILIYCFSLRTAAKLKGIDKILIKIKRRALYCKIAKTVKIRKLSKLNSGIERAIEAFEDKVESINAKEDKFEYFKCDKTRPSDVDLFNVWTCNIYPFNKFHQEKMEWNPALDKLRNALKYTYDAD